MSPVIIRKHVFFLVLLGVSLIGCSKPGYLVKIDAEGIDHAVVNQLTRLVKGREFKAVTEGRNTDSTSFITEFWKNLSNENYDYISVKFFGTRLPDNSSLLRLRIKIENEVRGLEPSIRSRIDELGDIFYRDLSREVGKKKVTIQRETIRPPVFY